jgi:hypothetical protein
MITSSKTNTVQRSGVKSESKFKIKATGKAFRILSDGLYSDKVRAIIRELSCNAFDAHVDADNLDTPFEVGLPNKLSPVFRIRDFGIGLSHNDVEHVYTTYFESTKTESNDFVGCLGLGSKSPFSYVDSFTITSFFNGTKLVYSAFLNEEETPTVALLSESKTDEPNGLEISFPVNANDFYQFQEKAEDVYEYFQLQPVIKGADVELTKPEYVMTGNGWGLRKSYGGAKAIMGNVVYPCHDVETETNDQRQLKGLPIDITFDIGELEVAASRESLSYNKATTATIRKRMEEIVVEIRDNVEKRIEQAATLWEARLEVYELIKGEYSTIKGLLDGMKFEWNGNAISVGYVNVDKMVKDGLFKIERFETKSYYRRYQSKTGVRKSNATSIQVNKSVAMYWNDLNVGSNVRCRQVLLDVNSDVEVVYLIHTDAAGLKALRDELGIAVIEPVSVIERIKQTRATGSTEVNPLNSAKLLIYDNDDADCDVPASYWRKDKVRVSHGGIYVTIDRYKVNDDTADVYINRMLDALEAIDEDNDIQVIGARWKVAQELEAAGGWVSLKDYVKGKVEAHLEAEKLGENIALAKQLNGLHNAMYRYDSLRKMDVADDGTLGEFLTLLGLVEDAVGDKAHADKMTRVAGMFGIEIEAKTDIDLDAEWNKVMKAYPLMFAINEWKIDSHKDDLQVYIKAMDLLKPELDKLQDSGTVQEDDEEREVEAA